MHFISTPRAVVLITICIFIVFSNTNGQKKEAIELGLTKRWSYPIADAAGKLIATDADKTFVGIEGGKVEALGSADGKRIWASEFGGNITSNFLAVENGLLFTTSVGAGSGSLVGSRLRSISKDTGITNWTAPLPDADGYVLSIFNGAVIVVSRSGSLQSMDAKTGSVNWMRHIADAFVAEPAFTVNSAIVAAVHKQIFTVALSTGERVSMRKVPYEVTALVSTASAMIVGDERGNVSYYVVGAEKPHWTFKSGGAISRILSIGDSVVASSHDNFVYFISDRNGSRVWKKRFSGRVAQVINLDDEYVLISAVGESRMEALDLSTGKVAGQVIFGESETVISLPEVSVDGSLFLLTNDAIYAYSNNSSAKK